MGTGFSYVKPHVTREVDELSAMVSESLAALRNVTASNMELTVAEQDRALKDAFHRSDALRRFLIVHRVPRYAQFDPVAMLRQQAPQRVRLYDSLALSATSSVTADEEQVGECVKLLWQSIADGGNAEMSTRIFVEDDRTTISVSPADPEWSVESIQFSNTLPISLEQYGLCWALATNGGDISTRDGGIHLHFTSNRPVPYCEPFVYPVLHRMHSVTRVLSPWRTAIGDFEGGLVEVDETVANYVKSLEAVLKHLIAAKQLVGRT